MSKRYQIIKGFNLPPIEGGQKTFTESVVFETDDKEEVMTRWRASERDEAFADDIGDFGQLRDTKPDVPAFVVMDYYA